MFYFGYLFYFGHFFLFRDFFVVNKCVFHAKLAPLHICNLVTDLRTGHVQKVRPSIRNCVYFLPKRCVFVGFFLDKYT